MDRAELIEVFRAAVRGCDPTFRVTTGLIGISELEAEGKRFGIAVGKAALAMARGAGPVEDGVAVTPVDDGDPLPAGWRCIVSAHPLIDARSQAAFEIAARIVEDDAGVDDVVIALISGGASALLEAPRGDITLAELRDLTAAVMAAGVPIAELNAVRSALSIAKAGGLVLNCAAPVVTLALSDVIDDDLAVIGSGPTFGPWFVPAAPITDVAGTFLDVGGDEVDLSRIDMGSFLGPTQVSADHDIDVGVADAALRARARSILDRLELPRPASVDAVLAEPSAEWLVRRNDLAQVIAPMRSFAASVHTLLSGVVSTDDTTVRPPTRDVTFVSEPLVGDVAACADRLAALGAGTFVAWGEPTLVVPTEHGEGGRAQQLALELAKRLRGLPAIALVAGSDGSDGPAPADRPTPAGAIVDGMTWDAILAAGIDPEAALARRDAGPALAAVGALVVTGPTGINHADLVVLCRDLV